MHTSFTTSLESIATLRRYWEYLRNRLPAGAMVPARFDVDPRDIADDLESTFVLERVAPGHARFRVTGQNIVDLLGSEAHGAPWGALFHGDSRSEMAARMESVFTGPAVLTLDVEATRPDVSGTQFPRMRGILLPLTNDAGHVSRVVGRFAGTWPKDGRPARFRIVRSSVERIGPVAGTRPESGVVFGAPRPAQSAPARPSAPADNVTSLHPSSEGASVGAPTLVPWLRVIEGGLSARAPEAVSEDGA